MLGHGFSFLSIEDGADASLVDGQASKVDMQDIHVCELGEATHRWGLLPKVPMASKQRKYRHVHTPMRCNLAFWVVSDGVLCVLPLEWIGIGQHVEEGAGAGSMPTSGD